MLLNYKHIFIRLSILLVCTSPAIAAPIGNDGDCDPSIDPSSANYTDIPETRCDTGMYCHSGYHKCFGCDNTPDIFPYDENGNFLSWGTIDRGCSWFLYKPEDKQWNKDTKEFEQCEANKSSPEGYIIYSNKLKNTFDMYSIPDDMWNITSGNILSYLQNTEQDTNPDQDNYYFLAKDGDETLDDFLPPCTWKPYPVSVNCNGGTASYCAGLYRQYNNDNQWFYTESNVSAGTGFTQLEQIPTKNCAVFNGFYDSDTQIFSANGAQTTAAQNITGPGTTITAQWTPAQYTLQINNINNATSNCTCGQNCAIPTYTNCTPGKYVSAITVLDDCGTIADGVFTPSATCQIQNGTQITLNATLTDCEKGYYCTGCQKHQCPNGQTSDAGTEREKDCYYGDDTIYTDTHGGSFTLPVKITVVSQN